MRDKSMLKLFKLEGYFVDKVEEREDRIYLSCRPRTRGMWYEDEYSTRINTTRVRTLRHVVIDTTMVFLVIAQRKFYFSKHKKRLWEALPGIQKHQQTSLEFRKQTILAVRDTNFSGAARRRGTSVMFPIRLLDELPEAQWCLNGEQLTRIGLDGKGVRKHQQIFTVTNLEKMELIGVLAERSQASLIATLKQRIPEEVRTQVKEVCIDMDTFFVQIIHEVFPHAHIVIDHFHVIAWGLHLLDQQKRLLQTLHRELYQIKHLLAKPIQKITKEEYQKLDRIFSIHPELKRSWKIIHQLRRVYWCTSYAEARSQLRKTIWLCEHAHIPEMERLAKTLRKWFEEILHYYLSTSTNALTEGIHTRFELIKRQHFGIKNVTRFAKRLFYTFLPLTLFLHYFVQSC